MKRKLMTIAAIIAALVITGCSNGSYNPGLPPVGIFPPSQADVIDIESNGPIAVEVNGNFPKSVSATAVYDNGKTENCEAALRADVSTAEAGEYEATLSYKGYSKTVSVFVYSSDNAVSETNFDDVMGNLSDGEILMIEGKITLDSDAQEYEIEKQGIRILGSNGACISTPNNTNVFLIKGSDTVIEGIAFESTAAAGTTNILSIQAAGAEIRNCSFTGNYTVADNPDVTSRGLEVSGNNFIIENCSFRNIRQPAYVNGVTGTIRNNTIEETRGFVIVQEAMLDIQNNRFEGNNAEDLVFIYAQNEDTHDAGIYTEERCLELSAENGNCRVDQQVKNFRVENGTIVPRNK